LPEFLHDNLAAPLDIRSYHLNMMPLGNGYMGGGLYIRPRDFIKLGQLFVAGGLWNGRQVVSKQWVDRATRPHAGLNEPNDYGYGWWIKDYQLGGKQYRAFYASGNGGQLVIGIPALDMVIMFAAGNYSDGRTWSKFRDELVPKFILPAVR
jgi:CubicO group peptidase (beta-lactamase class C family)